MFARHLDGALLAGDPGGSLLQAFVPYAAELLGTYPFRPKGLELILTRMHPHLAVG